MTDISTLDKGTQLGPERPASMNTEHYSLVGIRSAFNECATGLQDPLPSGAAARP